MNSMLIVGSAAGAAIGALHAWGLFRRHARRSRAGVAARPSSTRASGAYHGLWAILLWTLFGSYVLYLWLLSVALYAVRTVVRRWATTSPS